MARRGAFCIQQGQKWRRFSQCVLESRESGLFSRLSRYDRIGEALSDRAAILGSRTEFNNEAPDSQSTSEVETRLWGGFFRHVSGHSSFCNGGLPWGAPELAPSHSCATRAYSTVAEGEGSYDTGRNRTFFSRNSPVKVEDQTSTKITRLLREWTPSTPTDLESMEVPWNPFIVCRVLKSKIHANPAWEFFNWVKSQVGYSHNVYTYTAMIDQFGKAKNYVAMESLVAEMRKEGCDLSVVTYTALIHWYRHANNLDAARRAWNEMEDKGCKPNVFAYTAYITALAKGGCHLEVMEVYKSMQESGCRPNIYTYTVLIHSLVEAGKLDAATDLFDRLGEVNCKPNSVTYNLLIGAHAKAGNVDKVLSLYKAMRESGVGSSHETRGSVASVLQRAGLTEEAQQLLTGVEDYTTVVKIDAKGLNVGDPHATKGHRGESTGATATPDASGPGALPKPLQLAGKLRVWGPETDAILEHVGKRLKPPYVMNVMKELRRDSAVAWRFFQWAGRQEGYKHTQYTFMKLMEIVGRDTKAGSNELMDTILAELEKEETTNLVTFNTLIKYYAEFKSIAAVEEVFNRIKVAGFEPNEVTYTMLIDMYSREGMNQKSMEVYEEMQKAGCEPTMHTYTVLIHSLARWGKVAEAEALFDSMPSLGFKPSVVTYTALMQSLLKAGEVEKAMALFERMKAADVNPSRVTLKVLAKGLRLAGRVEDAEKIAHSLPYMRGMFAEAEEPQGMRKGERAVHDLMSSNFSQSPPASPQPPNEACAQTVA